MREIKIKYILEKDNQLKIYLCGIEKLERANELYNLFIQGWRVKDRLLFIGLKDKNGKEIYEGDIVRIKGIANEVYWEDRGCQFRLASQGDRQFDKTRLVNMSIIGEVIGNIYENPELLMGTK